MSKHEAHAAYSADWWTPPEWWEWVGRSFMEPRSGIFDPCPEDWVPGEPSGLDVPWRSPCYVNLPGGRGACAAWWEKCQREQERHAGRLQVIWACFNVEHLRHMRPSPFQLPGWLVMPRYRVQWIWGGPSDDKRTHGQPMKQPTNWSVFWSSVPPATPPVESIIVRTA